MEVIEEALDVENVEILEKVDKEIDKDDMNEGSVRNIFIKDTRKTVLVIVDTVLNELEAIINVTIKNIILKGKDLLDPLFYCHFKVVKIKELFNLDVDLYGDYVSQANAFLIEKVNVKINDDFEEEDHSKTAV